MELLVLLVVFYVVIAVPILLDKFINQMKSDKSLFETVRLMEQAEEAQRDRLKQHLRELDAIKSAMTPEEFNQALQDDRVKNSIKEVRAKLKGVRHG